MAAVKKLGTQVKMHMDFHVYSLEEGPTKMSLAELHAHNETEDLKIH